MQPKRFVPPCSLRALLSADLDLLRPGTIVAALPGAIECGVKQNESWRFLFRECWLIGYSRSAVVAGDSAALIPLVAAQVKQAVKELL